MTTAGYGTVVYGGIIYGGQLNRSPYASHITPFHDYAMRVLMDTPIAYWRMDEVTLGSLADHSGFNRHLDFFGTLDILNPPLVTGGSSKFFDSTDYATTTIPTILVSGAEGNGFSLESWVNFGGTPSGDRLIAGRANDGVFAVSDGFEFRLTSTNGTTYKVKYTVASWERTYHIFATFTGDQMALYVNGEYGSSTSFSGSFVNTDKTFYVGGTGSTGPGFYIDEVAVYQGAMPPNSINTHYLWGTNKSQYRDYVVADGGTYWPLDTPSAGTGLEFFNDFTSGTLTNLTVENGRMFLTDRSLTGRWDTLPMDVGELAVIGGSRIDWAATTSGVSVFVSTDLGSTWTAVTNHSEIPGFANGATTNKFIQFSVRFAANITDVLDKFHAVVYLSKGTRSVNSAGTASVSGTVNISESYYDSMNSKFAGATLSGSGSITIPAAETQNPVQAIDFWVRQDVAMPVLPSLSTTQTFVNATIKTPSAADFQTGEWTYIAMNIPNNTAPIVFATASGLAHLSTYNHPLTETQVASHFAAGFGKIYGTAVDRDKMRLFEVINIPDTLPDGSPNNAPRTRAYTNNWTLVSAA